MLKARSSTTTGTPFPILDLTYRSWKVTGTPICLRCSSMDSVAMEMDPAGPPMNCRPRGVVVEVRVWVACHWPSSHGG